VLSTFSLSDGVLKAVMDHESTTHPTSLKTLNDVITIANLLSKESNPLNGREPNWHTAVPPEHPTVLDLLEASSDELASLVAALRL
jgi:hypothetical protein